MTNKKPTEVRQKEIKSAVFEIIQNEGIKSISTKNLAKYTGLSEGAIFRHFKSKKDIMLSIIDDVEKDMVQKLREIAFKPSPANEKLKEYLCANIKYLAEHNGVTLLLFTEASHSNDTEMINKLSGIFNSQREFIANIIRDGIAGSIWSKDVEIDDITQFYMGIPITYNISIILTKKREKTEKFCEKMMKMFEKLLDTE